jgi:hypothetical protein
MVTGNTAFAIDPPDSALASPAPASNERDANRTHRDQKMLSLESERLPVRTRALMCRPR